MAKHTVHGFVYHDVSEYTGKTEIGFTMHRPTPDLWPNRVVVSEQSIEVEVPSDFDPRGQMVANLEEQKQKLRAEFAASVKRIDAKIQSLLAIEQS